MIYAGEQFWCPTHGRLPGDGQFHHVVIYNERGEACFPFHKLLCRTCGQEGKYVCDGTLRNCRIERVGYCAWHTCNLQGRP
jgi:hypothetical protein